MGKESEERKPTGAGGEFSHDNKISFLQQKEELDLTWIAQIKLNPVSG